MLQLVQYFSAMFGNKFLLHHLKISAFTELSRAHHFQMPMLPDPIFSDPMVKLVG
jgi:hypothetical protein